MHIIFQFPIIDLRPLLTKDKIRLPLPFWPAPDLDTGRPFIRQFGRLRNRKLGGTTGWAAEEFFCDARLSIKYDNLHLKGPTVSDTEKAVIYKCYRRLYSDGKFMNKLELGFIDDIETRLKAANKSTDLSAVIAHYCDLEVKVGENLLPLYKAGDPLAGAYSKSTTYRENFNQDISTLLFAGKPNITVVLPPGIRFIIPIAARQISTFKTGEKEITLYGWNYQHQGKPVKIWIIRLPQTFFVAAEDKGVASVQRNLRINLLRIHAEKETVRILLSQVLQNKVPLQAGSEQAKLVQSYLKNVAERLFAGTRLKLDQQDILNFALQSEDKVLPGNISTLEGIAIDFRDKYTTAVITGMAETLVAHKLTSILFLSASPTGKYPLDIQKELDNIENEKERGKSREAYVLHDELGVNKDELLRFLTREQPDILHISLHAQKIDGLYFQDEGGEPAPLTASDFADVLKTHTAYHPLKAVIINACNSKAHAEAALTYCDFTMGTNYPIPDIAAACYAKYFYQTLFDLDRPDIPRCHANALTQLGQSGISVQDSKPVNQMFEILKK